MFKPWLSLLAGGAPASNSKKKPFMQRLRSALSLSQIARQARRKPFESYPHSYQAEEYIRAMAHYMHARIARLRYDWLRENSRGDCRSDSSMRGLGW